MSSSEEQAQAAAVGTVLAGKYRLERELGAGGMGVVYLAQHETIERKVAIKVLHQELASDESVRRRFETEAKAIARLQHPNCVMLYEFGLSDEIEALFAVFEYVEGHSLETFVGQRLPLGDVVELGRQIAGGIAHAHDNNIIHRDLKPENIMIVADDDGDEFELKLLDFGIARIAEDDEKRTRLTKMGQMFGTPPYMSPEQVRAKLNVTYATDIYSIGVILYEMIEGELPFLGDTPIETVMMHLNEEVPAIRRKETPEALRDVVMRCLEKDIDDRFQSCEELLEALEAIEIDDDEPSTLANPYTSTITDGESAPEDSEESASPGEGDESASTEDADCDDELVSAPTMLAKSDDDISGEEEAATPEGDEEPEGEPADDGKAALEASSQDVTTQDLEDDAEAPGESLPSGSHKLVALVLALVLGVGGILGVVFLTSDNEEHSDEESERAEVDSRESERGANSEEQPEDADDSDEELVAVEDESGDDEASEEDVEEEGTAGDDDEETEVADEGRTDPPDPSTEESSPTADPASTRPQQPETTDEDEHEDRPTAPDAITLPGDDDEDEETEDDPAPAPEGIGLPQPD